jgi:tetratricopeptide (TPR) repeat protein
MFAFVLFPLVPFAQNPIPSDSAVTQADQAYTAHNWAAAESQYSTLLQHQPDNARFWYRLGVSARGNAHYAAALEALQKAKALGKGLPPSLADYEIAATYAAMGNHALALKLLKSSADAGFMQPDRLDNDAAWSSIRSDDQFIALAKEVRHNAAPCDDAEFRQFDFWLGDWDVASAGDGTQRGSSHIAKEMDGCVIWENWKSAGSPYFGKSYNTWNPNLKRWEQYWVDNSAGVMFFHGTLKGAIMDYWTDDVPQATGGTLLRHLQFFNLGPDKVRQFSQGSSDGGKTWQIEYDLIYTRAAQSHANSKD